MCCETVGSSIPKVREVYTLMLLCCSQFCALRLSDNGVEGKEIKVQAEVHRYQAEGGQPVRALAKLRHVIGTLTIFSTQGG